MQLSHQDICVLVVDDDDVIRFLHKKNIGSLKQFKPVLLEASNGQQALQMLQDLHGSSGRLPDLILLDINMPVLNGFEFMEVFQKLEWSDKIQVVIVSSSETSEDRERGFSLGVKQFFSKPITMEELESAIVECAVKITS